MTVDGKIATENSSMKISGEQDLIRVHELRKKYDESSQSESKIYGEIEGVKHIEKEIEKINIGHTVKAFDKGNFIDIPTTPNTKSKIGPNTEICSNLDKNIPRAT